MKDKYIDGYTALLIEYASNRMPSMKSLIILYVYDKINIIK